jgi:hypothetical protein
MLLPASSGSKNKPSKESTLPSIEMYVTVCWFTGILVPSLLPPNLNYNLRILLPLISKNSPCRDFASTTVVLPKYLFKSSGPLQLYLHATFYAVNFLAPHPTPKLQDHPFLTVHNCLFNMSAATLNVWIPSPLSMA